MYVVYFKRQGEECSIRFTTKANAVMFVRKYGGIIDPRGDKIK